MRCQEGEEDDPPLVPRLALAVANGVSVLVCLLAAILLCCLKLYKKIVYRLALYQVLSALAMASVGAAMGVVSINSSIIHGRVCTAIGFLGVYTEWTKLLFTMWVTFHLFCFAVLHKNLKKLEVLYVVTSLLVPALIAILPLVTHTYGLNSDGNACYIYANTSVAFIERLALWDGPAMLMLIAASTAMVVMVTKLTSQVCRRSNTCCLFGLKMSSHIDEKRYSLLVDYLTSCKEGDLRDSRVYPVGATANEKRRIRQQAAMFVLKERLLYYRATDAGNEICLKRVIANVKERTKIIRACHDGVDGCHYGRDKTRAKIGQTYWWKGLNRDVDQYCRQCDVCQRVNAKLEGKKAELHPIPVPSKVWSQIGIDLIVFVVMAGLTSSYQIREGNFCLFKLTGIEHRISSPYHPQTNGLDERTNQTLTRALIKFSEAKENWDLNIDAALYAYRIAKQDSS
eukprot:Em0185g1a